MKNFKIKFMKHIFCPIMGHKWRVSACKYMQIFGGMAVFYTGNCANCGKQEEGLIPKFQNTGSLFIAENIVRNTIPD